ncbi:MAG TPA: GGDEF domain-containing protein [Edaphobacter sp.]|nr:GGDEF domain-containing protein [Edaphobacter sp.]
MECTPIREQVVSEIERLSSRTFQFLTLPRALEDRFEKDTGPRRAMHLWREGLIAIALFDLFAIADYIIGDDPTWNTLIWRLGVVTPLALLVNITMRWNPQKIYRETSVVVVVCLAGLTHLYLEAGRNIASSAYAQAGVIIAILFANVVMRLRFLYALASSAILMAGEAIFLHHDRFLSGPEKTMGLILVLFVTLITLAANYSFGRDLRLVFLMLLRTEIQSEELEFANAELHRLSRRDNLTGLANRHSFEMHCEKLWKQANLESQYLAAILIDIDKFKAVNDLRGHFYGDKVLARVASLLQQSLRGKDDFAARFGGEEFVVLLPETTERGAEIVAERIRTMVETAGSPAVDDASSIPVSSTTVSCGVAVCLPNESCSMMDLLKAADKALYEAKRAGRNCVRIGEIGTEPATSQRPGDDRFGVQSEVPSLTSGHKILWG